jgi:hypothetical protein
MENALQDEYRIEICRAEDLPLIQSFIRNYWSQDHILASHNELMRWQHYDPAKRQYHFVLARDTEDESILGVLGYIPTSQFDNALAENDSIWLAIWKVREDCRIPGLGIHLRNYLAERTQPLSIAAVGLNPKTLVLYQAFGYRTGRLNRYYMLNPDKKTFYLVDGFDGQIDSNATISSKKRFVPLDQAGFHSLQREYRLVSGEPLVLPQKSFTYLYNRYLTHPIYQYQLYATVEKERVLGISIIRAATFRQHLALRFVDYWGVPEGLIGLRDHLRDLLRTLDAEYLDVYNVGIAEEVFLQAGFNKLDPTSRLVVPNHFEPFEKKNIDLYYAYKTDPKYHYVIFRGDADQDRPNLIRAKNG